MNILFVVSHLRDWPFMLPGVEVVSARDYLTDCGERGPAKVFNLCKSYRYQSRGYYVSLLAEARDHHPLPNVKAMEDLGSRHLVQLLSENMQEQMQTAFAAADCQEIEFDLYFGRDPDRRFVQLSEQIFNLLGVPLLHARFEKDQGAWRLHSVAALTIADLSPQRIGLAALAARECLRGHLSRVREPAAQQPTLAILRSPDSRQLPSNPEAIEKFREAADILGMRTDVISHADRDRIGQFDALFIRDTTNVNHYTYQMARQAAAAGLVVIDDPDSILKCTNKVYLTELLSRHRIPIPRTLVVHQDNVDRIIPTLGLPCILKQPDGAFSMGVVKVESPRDLEEKVRQLLQRSELILAQEYLPTAFDWRIGVLDRRPLFVCKYFMAPGHWQIIKREQNERLCEGMAEALAVGEAPNEVVDSAVRAANLIGDGFYGVDLKQHGSQCYIIEINDNPNVDAGNEDGVLKDALYREVMAVFRKRIETGKGSIAL